MESQTQQSAVMSTKDWIITLLITALPFIGLIMLFVWGFGSDTNPNKANFAKASLIWIGAMIVLYILFFVMFGAAIMSGMGVN